MAPEIDHAGWSCTREAGALVLTHPQRGEVVLLGRAARLHDLADGRRTVAELAALLEAVPEDIFAALDELADHGLLRARVAPPTAARGLGRREVLGVLAGAAAAAVAPNLALAAPDKTPALASETATALAPPHEHLHKESASKSEQQRKLAGGSISEAAQPFVLAVTAEESARAGADLLGAYESAAKRADSPAESAAKQRVDMPPALAGARESERKRSVATLVAEEESAKALVDPRTRGLTGEVAALSAREQHTKLAGDFGPDHEQTHKVLLAARTSQRQKADEQSAKQLQQAQEARWQADVADGRRAEQHDKAHERAREQQHKGHGQQVERAAEQREKHRDEQLELFRRRRAESEWIESTLAARAKTSKEAEQGHKARAGEEAQKRDAVLLDLKAREHAAKSRAKPG
ncbi:hypothetical protein [Nannocystis pusilla]|uniref:TolA protein n=1 Tax=Nannocystis pusilla TaxID=889268 RepID=A0ABS7U3V8_9BACT|nr:hypothetical protein [Nannocystis pusilla]MBZ5715091.1 hypothetical protein [Nannocystis pusilla]